MEENQETIQKEADIIHMDVKRSFNHIMRDEDMTRSQVFEKDYWRFQSENLDITQLTLTRLLLTLTY